MSSNVSFALNLQSDKGQKAIISRLECELRVLENLRKFLNSQIKASKEFSQSLENASQNAKKSLSHHHDFNQPSVIISASTNSILETTNLSPSNESVVSKVCLHILDEVLSTASALKYNLEFLQNTTLLKLNELIADKKLLLKLSNEYFHKIKGKLDQFEDIVSKAKSEYIRCFHTYESNRTKYEDQMAKGKGLKRPEEMREKFYRSRKRLNVCHSDYLIVIKEAENFDLDFRTILFPGLLSIQQTWCERQILEWKDILEQIWTKCSPKGRLKEFEYSKEYLELISKHKSQALQPKNFKFEPASFTTQPTCQGQLIVDSGTIEFLKGKLSSFERRLKACEKSLKEQNEEIQDMRSTVPGDMKSLDISHLKCESERLKSLKSMIDYAIKGKLSQSSIHLETISLASEYQYDKNGDYSRKNGTTSSAQRLANFFRTGKMSSKGKSSSPDESPPGGGDENGHLNVTGSGSKSDSTSIRNSGGKSSSISGSSNSCGPSPGQKKNQNDKSSDLYNREYFHGVLPREDVVRLLRIDGDFLLRETMKNDERQIVLSVFWKGPKHFIVQTNPEGEYRFEALSFPTVKELIDHYVKLKIPVTNRSGAIIKRPVKRENWELNNDDVKLIEKIGRGNFGDVYKADFRGTLVAVKTCKINLPEEQKKKFLQEGRILKQYDHPHIVKLVGICVQKQPIMIVMELVPGGSLLTYLKSKSSSGLSAKQMTKMCLDASAGMKYLEGKNCIHRDLASRNCLYIIDKDKDKDEKIIVKISDFGMSREEHEYIVSDGLKQIPIKWTSPEALNYGKYTSLSDVWAFGVLMWEIFSKGQTPYPGMSNSKAREMVEDGYRMPIVEGQPDVIYQLMTRCWMYEPEQRPRFSEIHSELELILKSDLI